MFFHVTIGSNIEPEHYIGLALNNLHEIFGALTVLPRVYTRPENNDSPAPFINTAVIFYSHLTQEQVKSRLNQIETSLGRDRSHPRCSLLPRTCDLDIIEILETADTEVFASAPETYVREILSSKRFAAIELQSHPELRDGSTTVHL